MLRGLDDMKIHLNLIDYFKCREWMSKIFFDVGFIINIPVIELRLLAVVLFLNIVEIKIIELFN